MENRNNPLVPATLINVTDGDINPIHIENKNLLIETTGEDGGNIIHQVITTSAVEKCIVNTTTPRFESTSLYRKTSTINESTPQVQSPTNETSAVKRNDSQFPLYMNPIFNFKLR